MRDAPESLPGGVTDVTAPVATVLPSRRGDGYCQSPRSAVSTAEPDVASTPMYLPTAVGLIAALTGWWATGAAVALPVALIGAIAVAAAIEDVRTGRIPNGLVLTGIAVIACAWGFVATLDNRLMGPLAIDSLAGFVLGGAPVVFVAWLVAPRLIGGGDWKLLVVLGAMIGFVAPPRTPPSG